MAEGGRSAIGAIKEQCRRRVGQARINDVGQAGGDEAELDSAVYSVINGGVRVDVGLAEYINHT